MVSAAAWLETGWGVFYACADRGEKMGIRYLNPACSCVIKSSILSTLLLVSILIMLSKLMPLEQLLLLAGPLFWLVVAILPSDCLSIWLCLPV